MYLALGITTSLYVLVPLGVFGTLTVQEVIDHRARPRRGGGPLDSGIGCQAPAAG